MKIFMTTLPIYLSYVVEDTVTEKRKVQKYNYRPQKGCNIDNNLETAFPIFKVMRELKEDDDYKVIAIASKSGEWKSVKSAFLEEIKAYGYDESKIQWIELEERQDKEVSNQLMISVVESLVDDLSDNIEIYASVEYGTKVMTIANICALQIVEKLRDNISVEGVFYGELKRDKGKTVESNLYDISDLFFFTQLVSNLDAANIKNSTEFVKLLLELGE